MGFALIKVITTLKYDFCIFSNLHLKKWYEIFWGHICLIQIIFVALLEMIALISMLFQLLFLV